MYRSILLSATAIALMAGSVSALACGNQLDLSTFQRTPQIKFPTSARTPQVYDSIAGLWQVSYIVNGQVALNTIDSWHSDGTELLSADKSPIVGNVCQGVWTSTGGRGVQLHHLGWTFDTSGNPSGTLVDDESETLNHKATTYKGTFDEKFYNLNGDLTKEVTGDTSAVRVTVQ